MIQIHHHIGTLRAHDDYFRQRQNIIEVLGATASAKDGWLAYIVPADLMYEVFKIAKSSMIKAFNNHFVKATVDVF